MTNLRHWLQLLGLGLVAIGPPFILIVWYVRTKMCPNIFKYALFSTAAVSIAVVLLFLMDQWLLERQFLEIAPTGEWTPSQEAKWTPADRLVVAAYFGDGGRNTLNLLVPPTLLMYSIVSWLLLWCLTAARRHAT